MSHMAFSLENVTEPVKIDVYFDYACPFAWAGQVWLDDVNEKTGGKLDITWKIFPLEQVNAKDPVLNLIEWEVRRKTLIAERTERDGEVVYSFDIRIQGEDETVFFDI